VTDLKAAITALAKHHVKFVIVGGVPVKRHSSGYLTEDLDFCCSRSRQSLVQLAAALTPFEPRPRDFTKDRISSLI
jgi:hypothetical protein